ncbi:hypothetical protein H1Q58_11435 [Planococcus maritimus]|uniref:Uncharacterized protein n=1 Tax=Planococcus maritimus TaxID=192421 RepID=A0A7D7RFD3_PLAMR|nr:hypothetical protein [Planococcus maritimus]QMT16581.1 hypothetical protein H1Q58_11435 [Planococcus maritimus]
MERKWVERKEVETRLDEEFNAILNMIGEGGPDYARIDDTKEPKELKDWLAEEFDSILNMIGEGGPDYARNDEDIEMQIMKHDEAKAKDLH